MLYTSIYKRWNSNLFIQVFPNNFVFVFPGTNIFQKNQLKQNEIFFFFFFFFC